MTTETTKQKTIEEIRILRADNGWIVEVYHRAFEPGRRFVITSKAELLNLIEDLFEK